MTYQKTVEIIGGGTFSHLRSHLALAAPAFGTTARQLKTMCQEHSDKLKVNLHLTKMAQPRYETGVANDLVTNEDVAKLVKYFVGSNETKIIFFNPALCDFDGEVESEYSEPSVSQPVYTKSGKYEERLHSDRTYNVRLSPAEKIVSSIRRSRKDIFLVSFKTTCGATEDQQYVAALGLLKKSSSNLVLANDTQTRTNMIVTPEEARYHVTNDRQLVLRNLVEMAYLRSHLTFTRSTVVSGEPVAWSSDLVPNSLRRVVDSLIQLGAYKPFNGATVGHFAVKLNDTTFLTSRRKTNFNELDRFGLVRIVTDGPDSVIAYGSKPSVGGQSQRIIFKEHPEYDCVAHAHIPIRPDSKVPQISQRAYECGSHSCGENTSRGLERFGNLSAVYLQEHGPNVVFHRNIDPKEVMDFILANFDPTGKTGGPVQL